ncbi:MAG: carbohydrate ABC transporter permease [Phycisphaerae bacterium]|nr:carbohydrate ABC transporter permease [Phycisphaerae bacterium]
MLSRRSRERTKELIKHGLILLVLFSAFFPLYIMVVISFKDNDQFVRNPWWFDSIGTWKWENWSFAWDTVKIYIANSIVTSVAATAFCLLFATLTSYVIAKHKVPGRGVVYYGLIALMFLPGTAATLMTLFTLLKDMHLLNSLWPLIILGATGGQALCVFILRQFIEEIPNELFESAQLDGASSWQQIMHIVLPMSGAILGTLAILQFIGNWNNLMLPLIVMRDDVMLTVPVGLMRLEGEYVKEWGQLMAGYTISSIPMVILFIFTMRLFIRGLTAGAIKG